MTAESLQNIIAVENELNAREQAEKARATQWLAEQEAAIRAEFGQRRDALAAEMEAAREQTRASAERMAAETVGSAEQRTRQLSEVNDEALRGVLARHLVAMMTGRLP
ncbi:MAG: hypothetical protein ACYDBT_03265 [Desulfobulbaceae bacterium]